MKTLRIVATAVLVLASFSEAFGQISCYIITPTSCDVHETESGCIQYTSPCQWVGETVKCTGNQYDYEIPDDADAISGFYQAGPGQTGTTSYSSTPVVCLRKRPCAENCYNWGMYYVQSGF